MTLYKSMQAGLKAAHGNINFKVGKWFHQDGTIKACENGFHASKNIIDAMGYVACEILCEVEVKGTSDLSESDKECWSDMKITKAYVWDKEASVKLAIFAAKQVIDIYEKEYPKDKRPREALEAAERWLKDPTEENREAVRAAAWAAEAAAWAAEAAAEAASWAARSARSAAEAARSAWAAARSAAEAAARAAARAAEAAARAAARAAEAAAWVVARSVRAAALQKCHDYVVKKIIPTLKEYK